MKLYKEAAEALKMFLPVGRLRGDIGDIFKYPKICHTTFRGDLVT